MLSNSPQETKKLGESFGKKVKGGEVIGLIGQLGGGKTVFVQGIAKGLGIKEKITSPSFILMKSYPVKKGKIKNLVHIDCWRIKSENELETIGLEDYLGKKNTVIVIEWADKVKKFLPKNSIIFCFKLGKKENQRIISKKSKYFT